MTTMRWLCAGSLFLMCLAVPQWVVAGQNTSDVGQGKILFDGMCSVCHGYDGVGGEGPSLDHPLPQDDQALRDVIGNGIPNRGMPRVRRLTDNEVRQLVGYVRSLSRRASPSSTGNAERGGEVYKRAGCASCHIIKGEGGSFGPELTAIGAVRGPEHLRQALVDPGAVLPRGTLPIPARGYSEFQPIRVVTRDGRELRGIRINEDTFTIQMRDTGNRFHSLKKSDLRQIEMEAGASLMPGYKDRLTASEIEDLVAYLGSLGGAK